MGISKGTMEEDHNKGITETGKGTMEEDPRKKMTETSKEQW